MLFVAIVALGYLYTSGLCLNSILLKDCEPGKFFWSDDEPAVFFACLQKRHRAVKMRCRAGTKMCLLPPDQKKTFGPCQCSTSPTANNIPIMPSSAKSGVLLNSAVVGQAVTSKPEGQRVVDKCAGEGAGSMSACG